MRLSDYDEMTNKRFIAHYANRAGEGATAKLRDSIIQNTLQQLKILKTQRSKL